ncbi:MAG: hypothetical protein O7A64_02265 [Alphaproteobacteria bacterium]|nr:hypothetical protein [Alphaproteobacteria bacterium]
MDISFASWNVEAFGGGRRGMRETKAQVKQRTLRCVDRMAQVDPDIFGIYEVVGKYVFDDFMKKMPNHVFFLTEDVGVQEVLVGVKRKFAAFITQRSGFKSKVRSLRPGALTTIRVGDEYVNFLFLHLKSGPDPRSWGLRYDMIDHVNNLKKSLDKREGPGGRANFIALGDLNTMGYGLKRRGENLDGKTEIGIMEKQIKLRKLKRLKKDHENAWWGGGRIGPSNLDHVLAAEHLDFVDQGGAEIRVLGWPEKDTKAQQRAWINKFSDHGILTGVLRIP